MVTDKLASPARDNVWQNPQACLFDIVKARLLLHSKYRTSSDWSAEDDALANFRCSGDTARRGVATVQVAAKPDKDRPVLCMVGAADY